MRVLFEEMRVGKLAKLIEIEGFEDETALFAAAISDTVCPAICCNADNPECDYTAEMEPDQDQGWCEVCEWGRWCPGSCSGASSDVRRTGERRERRVESGRPDRALACPWPREPMDTAGGRSAV